MQGRLDFMPEVVGSFWGRQRGKGVQLDVVAAAPREKRLLIGEAKWGRGEVSRNILTDLVERSRRMPQVAAGWQVDYVLFSRDGFTQATQAEAKKIEAALIDLNDLESTLTY